MDAFARDEDASPEEGTRDCVFCKIINAEIPATIVHSDEDLIVINDINPKAPIHLLVIPRKHIASLTDLERSDAFLMGQVLWTAKIMADEHRIATRGYKIVLNTGTDGGQTVPHVHAHVLGGADLRIITL